MISIVVPTLNEQGNIEKFYYSALKALKSADFELIFVDDSSNDSTVKEVEDIAKNDNKVRLIKRAGKRNLSASVAEGLSVAKGNILFVIDADMQHPPKLIRRMAKISEKYDFVVACRNGSDSGLFRKIVSWFSNNFSRKILNLKISDPMSGFFCIRKNVFYSCKNNIKPRGYKILLELLVKSESKSVAEVGFVFRKRFSGSTKTGIRVFSEFLIQVFALFLWKRRFSKKSGSA